jgi:uncharacterized membrane protein YfcA
MTNLPFIFIGVLTGIFAGIFGVGGGVILVPVLVFAMGYEQFAANGTSLVALLLPVGLLGVIEYHRAGKISYEQIRIGLIIAIGIFVGTYFGAKIATSLPQTTLRKAFSIFLVGVALKLWFQK